MAVNILAGVRVEQNPFLSYLCGGERGTKRLAFLSYLWGSERGVIRQPTNPVFSHFQSESRILSHIIISLCTSARLCACFVCFVCFACIICLFRLFRLHHVYHLLILDRRNMSLLRYLCTTDVIASSSIVIAL